MKVVLCLTLCIVVAAAYSYNPTVHSSVYKPGEEYIYHYKGQILSGIPKSSKQYGGILIDTLVRYQFQQDYKVVMKLEKIKLFKINNKIMTLPSEPLPESELTRLTGEQASVITEFLVKPIKFRFDEGEVRELEKETIDRYWSVNIKKGIISLFQVTLKEKTPYSSDSFYTDPVMSRAKPYSPRGFSPMTPYWKLVTKTNSAYQTMETDVMGNCESEYTVITDKTHMSPSSSHMRVSRVKNFNKCITKPYLVEGIFQGVYRSPAEKDLIQQVVHTDYIISGDRTHFLIKEATLRGKYFFLINGLEGADLSTYIFQKLTLKTVEPIRQPIHLTSPKIDSRGLLMVIPKASLIPEKQMVEEPVYGRRYPSQQQFFKSYEHQYNEEEKEEEYYPREQLTQLVTAAEEKLSELVQCLYPSNVDKKCSTILYELSRIVREMNKHQLKELITRYIHNQHSDVEYKKTEILLDILPTLPNPDAAKVLIELIKEKKISEIRGALLVKPMTMLVKPTPAVIKKVWELFKELPKEPSSIVSEKKMLRRSLLLGVGTLTHRLVNVMRAQGKPQPQIINFVETISSELNKLVEQTNSEDEKILVLKAIGNMAVSENIVPLKNLIEDPRQTPSIRVQAVYGLRRLAKEFDKQVCPLLLSIFMDVNELREIRQAAFIVLLNSKPSYTTLQMLAHRIRHEPDSQIRTLVYSSLVNLAMYSSHEPEHKQLMKNARLIMKTLPPVHIGVHDSIAVHLNKFSEEYDLGGALNLIKIKSRMSGLPESLIANFQGTLFGKHRKLIEVGATGKSLEKVLKKLFGPHGLLKEYLKGRFTMEDLFKPLTRMELGHVEMKMREILGQLMSESRPELEQFGITSELYFHILGNELQYITLNSENIQDIINKATRILPELLMKLREGVKIDLVKSLSHIGSLSITSPLGIPVSFNVSTMGIVKLQGHFKLNNLPELSEMINRFSTREIPSIGFSLNLEPYIDVSQSVAVGPDMRWIGCGVGAAVFIKVQTPVKLVAQVDPIQHSLTVKYFVPKENTKVLRAIATPYTFVKYTPTTLNKLPYVIEIREIKGEDIVKQIPYTFNYHCKLTGLEVEAHGLVSGCGPRWCPVVPFFGKQELNVITRPVTPVDFVQLKIKSLRTNVEWEGVPATYETFNLYEKDQEDMEEEQKYFNIHNSYGRRELSRSMIEREEFEPVRVNPVFQSEPIKRQVLVTLCPNNPQLPKTKGLFTWLMSRQYWKNQINVQFVHLTHGETPKWKVEMDSLVNPLMWYPEETYKNTPVAEMKLKWFLFNEANELKIKIVPGSPFEFTRELKENSILPVVDNLPEANAQKYKYTLEIEVPQMTPRLMRALTIGHDLIKYKFFSKVTTSIPVQPLNKLLVAVEVLPWWEKMNVIVKSPRETNYISNIPVYWNPFQPTSEKMKLHDIPAWKWSKSVEDKEYFRDTVPYKSTPIVSGKCELSPEELTTFDGVTIPMFTMTKNWEKNCEMVMTQHCSNEGLFSVIGLGTGDSWTVKVLVPKYEISLLNKYRELTVLVNGEQKYLTEGRPIVLSEEYRENREDEVLIEKLEQGVVLIKSRELGIQVKVNANVYKTTIKMSPLSMLQGQLCGMCGNFNQEQSDDYYTPTDFQPENRDFLKMITKNVLKSQTCSFEKFKTETNDYCTKPTYRKMSRLDNEQEMTCTSEQELPHCAHGCVPETTKFIETCFKCESPLPRQTFIPPRWDSYEPNSCTDFFQRVEVPTRCVPAY